MDHCSDVKPETIEQESEHAVHCHLYTDQSPAGEEGVPGEAIADAEAAKRSTDESQAMSHE